jgi:hypothetical protein
LGNPLVGGQGLGFVSHETSLTHEPRDAQALS